MAVFDSYSRYYRIHFSTSRIVTAVVVAQARTDTGSDTLCKIKTAVKNLEE